VLWNPNDSAYYRKPLKNDAWREIADSMKMDAEECKNKMISLLASYRRENAKIRKHEGTGKGNVLFYCYSHLKSCPDNFILKTTLAPYYISAGSV
jgi:hypothetical protein